MLSLLSSACVTQSQRSADYTRVCIDAEVRGAIYLAEANCERSWFGIDNSNLKPNVRSEKLYDLARIKRQLNKYIEAEKYIQQALEIEQTVTGANNPEYALRLVELSLSIAGQGDFPKAAITLEPVLNVIDQFAPQDKKRTVNVLKHRSSRIQHAEQHQLAERFKLKVLELQ
ncbi:MAG: tetratricopeptide (TPR) repeat protein [Paraglaciecola sp.]|jgi:tetratricopeptide (TPR) repeat protein